MRREIPRVLTLVLVLVLISAGAAQAGSPFLSEKFDHELHDAKVFRPQNIPCSKCHNFSVDPSSGRAVPNEALKGASLKLPLKQICHECHQGAEAKNKVAPKTCFTCHASASSLSAIKPENHRNIVWQHSHATEARIAGESCTNCHATSQCVKCHSHRQDLEPVNHPRNFRFTHSIQARLQPQRCDACHTKTYCSNCHLGK